MCEIKAWWMQSCKLKVKVGLHVWCVNLNFAIHIFFPNGVSREYGHLWKKKKFSISVWHTLLRKFESLVVLQAYSVKIKGDEKSNKVKRVFTLDPNSPEVTRIKRKKLSIKRTYKNLNCKNLPNISMTIGIADRKTRNTVTMVVLLKTLRARKTKSKVPLASRWASFSWKTREP